ncbi:zinc finger MYM-type protein 6-like [Sipha flava]|uniref:Zinc finger MYM-type protein 6-like n=1 Tax=Sipha flava TaxID=143950 RepID=A0A8B8FVV5_9HEMI|nr:zinc finger MYM-type protein 6-like [Sipha flava]
MTFINNNADLYLAVMPSARKQTWEITMLQNKLKRKGGAEKNRNKKRKELLEESKACLRLDSSSDWQHIYLRIGEHENSAHHRDCVNSHFMTKEDKDIKKMIIYGCTDVRGQQIERRRNIVERIIDVVKLIGKCGLAYRGKRNEAAYTLNNPNIDHVKSEKIKDKDSKQGGGLITFLSKNTFNNILEVCSDLITETIVSEIKKSRMYSIQIDTTQDVRFKKCTTTTGQAFADLVVQTLQSKGISLNNCIGNSTDGASNMQGQYSGFAKKMEDLAPNQVHVWCVGHILNLVLQDVTSSEIHVANLFELLNSTASFIRRSYVRMDRWNDIVTKMKLNLIGETKWWAKEVALKQIFGLFDTKNFNAIVFLKIFSITRPLSKYLQSNNCDILQACNMIKKSEVQLQQVEFSEIHEKTNIFIEHMNDELDEIDIVIEKNAMKKISEKLNFINPNITQASLKEEFLDFIHKFDSLKQNISFSYVNEDEDLDDYNLDEKEYLISENASYPSLFLAYKYILTLSVSQVSCERSFSKLKYIKNRLRSTLSSSHMEQLMIICTEKDIINQLENKRIIDKFASQNKLLKTLLIL